MFVDQPYTVYRGMRRKDQMRFFIKTTVKKDFLLKDYAKLKQEYQILNNINSAYVIKPTHFRADRQGLILLLEDIPHTQTLSNYIKTEKFSIETFDLIASQLAQAINFLHKSGIMHCALSAENILILPKTNTIKLTGFHLATYMAQVTQENCHPSALPGNLNYISPEQTGYTNRPIDYRADLYALGIIYYQMLTGNLPLINDDINELIYEIITKIPIAPHKINNDIPVTLSNIIMKLLAKSADRRYRSTQGLIADLVKFQQYAKTEETFKLGEKRCNGIITPAIKTICKRKRSKHTI